MPVKGSKKWPDICMVDGCESKETASGYCAKHNHRRNRLGDALAVSSWHHDVPVIERFWMKVEKTDGCWRWTGNLSPTGYGLFTVGKRPVRAHRFIYETLVAPVPEGLVLDHLCRNRACVRVDHLEVVTGRENVLRGIGPSAVNAAKTHCNHGHEYTPENVRRSSTGGRVCLACLPRQYKEVAEGNRRRLLAKRQQAVDDECAGMEADAT